MEGTDPDRSRPPGPAPPARPGVAGFFLAVLILHVAPGAAAQAASPAFGLAWSEIFAFLLPALAAAAGANLRPGPFLLFARRPTPAQVLIGLAAGFAGFAAAGASVSLWSLLLPTRWVASFDLTPFFQGGLPERAALVAVTSIVAPLCEEVAFRGYLQSALRLRFRAGAALALGAGLFAAMHLDPVRLPGLLLLGGLFAWLAYRSGSIWPAVAAHAANNGVASLLAASGVTDGGTPSGSEELRGALVLLGAGAAGLWAATAAFRRAAPSPPAPAQLVAPLDPGEPMGRFSLARLPVAYWRALAAGLVTLSGLAMWAAFRR